ncbi:hypothetical protein SAMD00019534_016160 [Acytostelium subglobosum LB1]|uniref:hypothetical protein n=1 Tax=Acytostelium subglobosum LB1 TaxID=1410327 RepID=UPI000644EDE9|nr:hypothetical protein SAMD00019534_016160 [Acytostelium subglobosum LB1]GAM18441.1 hypothetical protein SAMD00019534_016160 [Acytostelium subglobosum LB1]|eukprot:XP_012757661.1 hypothetical protein SAMD00019534_016160 [Acytostelium subglobosum LB1]
MSSADTAQQPAASDAAQGNQPQIIVLIDKYQTLSRLYDYSLVNKSVSASLNWYNYAKGFTLLKKPMELSESTIGLVAQPIYNACEPMLKQVDKFSVDKLDKIETNVNKATEYVNNAVTAPVRDYAIGKISTVDASIDNVLEFGHGKIQGTKIAELVNRSEALAESIVDTVLPAQNNDTPQESDMFNVERRFPVLYKLRNRVNYESVKHIPANSYQGVAQTAAVKQIASTVESLEQTFKELKGMSVQEIKDDVFSKKTIDKIFNYLDATVEAVGSLSVWIKQFSPDIDFATRTKELTAYVTESRNRILQIVDQNEKLRKFKEESTRILEKTGTILKDQIEATSNKLKNSDYAIVKQTVTYIESTIQTIREKGLLRFNEVIEYLEQKYNSSSPAASSSSSSSSSTAPATSSTPTEEPEEEQ